MQELRSLRDELIAAVDAASGLDALEQIRLDALGRKGRITALMKGLGQMPPDERREAGKELNVVKESVAEAIEQRKAALEEAELDRRLATERIDVTLPVRPEASGRIHPITQTIDECVAIFGEMGFALAEGPEIENDFRNFTALNIPPEHPARQEHDTFYFPEKEDGSRLLLRTHTSTVQVHTMEGGEPPIRIIAPGRTYRSDYDATHSPMFHQIEGLAIEDGIHMGHLKGCLAEFFRAFFGVEVPLRFRASHFPFTEPSAEVDIQCWRAGGELVIGEGDDWLEVLGCGMVHPNVLRNCGLDPDRHRGFAFGMGIERIAMLKHGIPDLRTFYESDLRWLRHYGFPPFDVPGMVAGLAP
ncbi:MAG: phenylalanine--tRNA ligase subunit alpha [Acetobacterales bacterium]